MATTTFETIREQQEALMEALTPNRHASTPFRVAREELDFRAWAENNPVACFRRFSIRTIGPNDPAEVTSLDVEEITSEVEVLIAYPKHLAKYGPENLQDMDDLINQDEFQVRDAIGSKGYSNWVSGQSDANETAFREDGENVTFLNVSIELRYYRAMS